MLIIRENMEQIVKMFVHQSYYIENDLLIDYNVEKEVIFFNKNILF